MVRRIALIGRRVRVFQVADDFLSPPRRFFAVKIEEELIGQINLSKDFFETVEVYQADNQRCAENF